VSYMLLPGVPAGRANLAGTKHGGFARFGRETPCASVECRPAHNNYGPDR
jgi:hypothetical protein